MSIKDFTANVISATKVVPDGNFKDSKASGVWDINEALDLIKGGNWPNAANINPAAFVDGLFQCHLYDGTGSQQTITNNIDFTKGGLIITKRRDSSTGNGPYWNDTERGVTNYVRSDSDGGTGAQNTSSTGAVVSTSSTGYVVGTFNGWNNSSGEYVSWSFRKQPKFFDVVTYSGTGSAQNISHSLGSVPGMILVKRTDSTASWNVYHRGLNGGTNPEQYGINLNTTGAEFSSSGYWNNTAPTSTQFTVGTSSNANASGGTYVAYLFAHNNNDGGFGEPGDQDIIKCGTYTGVSATEISVDLGFEPQFIMIKRATGSSLEVYASWFVQDTMRGMVAKGSDAKDKVLYWNKTQAEGFRGNGGSTDVAIQIHPNATGFTVPSTNSVEVNQASETYIYMAIRRGGMQTPTAASSVFKATAMSSSFLADTGFAVDLSIDTVRTSTGSNFVNDRLRGSGVFMKTDAGDAESTGGSRKFDSNQGVRFVTGDSSGFTGVNWAWKRARGYFDIAAWTGTGSDMNISHNLGVVPEMIWARPRSYADHWSVFHKDATYDLKLDTNAAESSGTVFGTLTSSVMPVTGGLRASSHNYVAYLFATVAGVSKVGSYTGDGNTGKQIDCGFTSGASFIMIKRADSTGNWFVWDSARGIISGNDPYLIFDDTDAEVTSGDNVDPHNAGFIVNGPGNNVDGATHIFYAIAATS